MVLELLTGKSFRLAREGCRAGHEQLVACCCYSMQTQKGLAAAQGAAVIAEPSYFTGDILTHQHTKLIFAQLEGAGCLRGKAGSFSP